MSTKKYTIDLAGQMAECEANYARIMQLLPDMDTVDSRAFGVERASGQQLRCRIEITERCKYTTMLDICEQPLAGDLLSWSSTPRFSLRVYHDARMAEVIGFDRHHHFRASYDYPNNNMYQRDEKTQLNTFLGEWLSHCLEYGHVLDDPAQQSAYATSSS